MKKRIYFVLTILVLSVVGCQKDRMEIDIPGQTAESLNAAAIKHYNTF
jgi:hypothetical protein